MTEIFVSLAHTAWASLPGAAHGVERAVEAAVEAALAALPRTPAHAELAVELADDAAVHALNRQFLGQDKPTNVLSFPAYAGLDDIPFDAPADGPPVLLGDIILAYETVMREAAEQGKPALDHVRHLCVHGTLHLFGFDHADDAEAQEMEDLERRILAGLGVPDPYRPYRPGEPRVQDITGQDVTLQGRI